MSVYTLASYNSRNRGYDYYKNGCIKSFEKISEHEFNATVEGTKKYVVYLNNLHPRKSTCSCPHANGRIICKHMVAVYFKSNPNFVSEYEADLRTEYEEAKKHIEARKKERLKIIKECEKYVNSLSVEEMKELLLEFLISERFYETREDEYYEDFYNYYEDYFEDE